MNGLGLSLGATDFLECVWLVSVWPGNPKQGLAECLGWSSEGAWN